MSNYSIWPKRMRPHVSQVATYRRRGEELVRTPVWTAERRGRLVFRTFARTGKVRRLGAGGRVQVDGRAGTASRLSGRSAWSARCALFRTSPLVLAADLYYRPRLGRVVVYEVDLPGIGSA